VDDQTDSQLLCAYAERRSEPAFAELVRRHVDLVYSAARRMVCDAHLAEDVTQGVFVALAKNAAQLKERPVLSGWLHRAAQHIAAQTVRADVRRRAREQEAAAMNQLLSAASDAPWERIAPHLDAALGELNDAERDAILLRYFEKKSAPEMAGILGISDEAAQKRVSRAVERLREFFAKHGITVGASGLVVLISTNAVQAAPAGLVAAISAAAALAGTTLATTATKAIAMTTLQKAIVTATVAVLAGAGIYEARQAATARTELQTLKQQKAPLAEQIRQLEQAREDATNQIAALRQDHERLNRNTTELLRLRSEVGVLRRQQLETERAGAVTASRSVRTPPVAGVPQPNSPAPFQLQLVLDEPGDNTEVMTNGVAGVDGASFNVEKTPLMDHTAISSATVTTNASGAPQIEIEFSQTGRDQFARITKENINKRLAIVLDGKLYSAPVIRSEISGGKAQISGSFSEDEARELASKINEAIGKP